MEHSSTASSGIVSRVFIDPVCGMNVPAGRREISFDYQGCSYYFCAEACRRAFQKDPVKYLKPWTAARKDI